MNWKWLILISSLVGCSQQQRAVNALDMAVYQDQLAECRKKGKAANSYLVYEQCAIEVDKQHKVNGQ